MGAVPLSHSVSLFSPSDSLVLGISAPHWYCPCLTEPPQASIFVEDPSRISQPDRDGIQIALNFSRIQSDHSDSQSLEARDDLISISKGTDSAGSTINQEGVR